MRRSGHEHIPFRSSINCAEDTSVHRAKVMPDIGNTMWIDAWLGQGFTTDGRTDRGVSIAIRQAF